MKRLLVKIGRFFWSRGFLKFLLWTATLILLFYAEENWRGARIWAATKAKWEAKGESFDYARLGPLPVPTNENLIALPLFKLERIPNRLEDWDMPTLRQAVRERLVWRYPRDWEAGELTDAQKLRQEVEAHYRQTFPAAPVPPNPLEQFDQLYPVIAELRSAASVRRYCLFPRHDPPQSSLDLDQMFASANVLPLTRVLTVQGDLALAQNRPDLALEAIQLNARLVKGLTQHAYIVSGLIAAAMTSISLNTVYNGLARHVWNDEQLAQLDQTLGGIDFLAGYQSDLRGWLWGLTIPALDEARAGRPVWVQFESNEAYGGTQTIYYRYTRLWPAGWFDQIKAGTTSQELSAVHLVDLKRRVVDVREADRLAGDKDDPALLQGIIRIFHPLERQVLASAIAKFSREQVWIDEARIACALERYRLARWSYPETMEMLAPEFLDQVPHDIMNGGPYPYHLKSDGTFLLYSVGWNQKDDGGTEAYQNGSPTVEDKTQGDWVWPTPKVAPEKSP